MSDQGPRKPRPHRREGAGGRTGSHGVDADDPGGRRDWFLASRRDTTEKAEESLYLRGSRQRHGVTGRRDAMVEGEPPAPPGGAGTVNWTPLGPSVIAHGQASGNPPVSGRITTIAAGPAGGCAYIGAAN